MQTFFVAPFVIGQICKRLKLNSHLVPFLSHFSSNYYIHPSIITFSFRHYIFPFITFFLSMLTDHVFFIFGGWHLWRPVPGLACPLHTRPVCTLAAATSLLSRLCIRRLPGFLFHHSCSEDAGEHSNITFDCFPFEIDKTETPADW